MDFYPPLTKICTPPEHLQEGCEGLFAWKGVPIAQCYHCFSSTSAVYLDRLSDKLKEVMMSDGSPISNQEAASFIGGMVFIPRKKFRITFSILLFSSNTAEFEMNFQMNGAVRSFSNKLIRDFSTERLNTVDLKLLCLRSAIWLKTLEKTSSAEQGLIVSSGLDKRWGAGNVILPPLHCLTHCYYSFKFCFIKSFEILFFFSRLIYFKIEFLNMELPENKKHPADNYTKTFRRDIGYFYLVAPMIMARANLHTQIYTVKEEAESMDP